MFNLYNLLLKLLTPVMFFYVAWRLLTGKDSLKSLRQKLGRYDFPPPKKGGIWIHGVSVGETNAAALLVDELLKQNKDLPVTFSTSTKGGMETSMKKLTGKATITYFPFDFHRAVKSALSFFSPRLIVLMETEIWPNLIYHAGKSGIGTAVVNGRLSDNSYRKYSMVRPIIAPFFGSIDLLLMQSKKDAERIVSLGADKNKTFVAGNIKFDGKLPDENAEKSKIRHRFSIPENAAVVVLASSHAGEDELFLESMNKLSESRDRLYPVIAPRHVQRADAITELCADRGFKPPRLRSENSGDPGSILILDTLGELAELYGAADVAVIGGSFIPRGGQNPLEASAWKLPVLFGPHMNNFREISQKLVEAGGAIAVTDGDSLTDGLSRLLDSEEMRRKTGAAGYDTILQNRGALHKTVVAIEKLFKNMR